MGSKLASLFRRHRDLCLTVGTPRATVAFSLSYTAHTCFSYYTHLRSTGQYMPSMHINIYIKQGTLELGKLRYIPGAFNYIHNPPMLIRARGCNRKDIPTQNDYCS